MNLESMTPKSFLKARHPERFSDSLSIKVETIDRANLEYHLSTLTSRSQEKDFERFARELIRKEICPNLLSQTGPTGGGDSKVDAETIPVTRDLELTWHIGINTGAANQRWAFAISAKEDWKSKLTQDVEKIIKTERQYERIFFVTNQYVPDKRRADLEDKLQNTYGTNIRILDKTWILDSIFTNNRQDLAITYLHAPSNTNAQRIIGPLDYQKLKSLTDLESKITNALTNNKASFVTVDDCINSAILSRELENPEIETYGRFERAKSLAEQIGTNHQRVLCQYEIAWTHYFWKEDIPKCIEAFNSAEEIAIKSRNLLDFELLTNLWLILAGHSKENKTFKQQTNRIKRALKAFANTKDYPTASLEARGLLLKMKLVLSINYGEPIDKLLRQFSQLIKESENVIGFSWIQLANTLLAIGGLIDNNPQYDKLHDQLVETVARRKGDIESGKLLALRGEQQLNANKPANAIQSLGRSLHLLAKEESQEHLCESLYLLACAYERLGLLWAARGTVLAATSISGAEAIKHGNESYFLSTCTRRLKWIELQLGRISQSISWHRLDIHLRDLLAERGLKHCILGDGDPEYDAVLGILFLRSRFDEVSQMNRLPDALDELRLPASSAALKFVLGHESAFIDTLMENNNEGDKRKFFVNWRDQPASDELHYPSFILNSKETIIYSTVLGCTITILMPSESPFTDLGECCLSAIECVLATSILRQLPSVESKLMIKIICSDSRDSMIDYKIKDDDTGLSLDLYCKNFDLSRLTTIQMADAKKCILDMILSIMHRICPDHLAIQEIIVDDFAIQRAMDFSANLRIAGSLLGDYHNRKFPDWANSNYKEYTLQRTEAWDTEFDRPSSRVNSSKNDCFVALPKSGIVVPKDLSATSHRSIATLSLIRSAIWDKAEWQGVGYLISAVDIPIMALVFRNSSAARAIFTHWNHELGKVDVNDSLRIVIITNIDKSHPYSYRVMTTSEINDAISRGYRSIHNVARIHTLTPSSGQNLRVFMDAYNEAGEFLLAPATVDDGRSFQLIENYSLKKCKLVTREAWSIGRNDPDCCGVLPEDLPVLPPNILEHPVVEHLRGLRAKQSETVASKSRGRTQKTKRKNR